MLADEQKKNGCMIYWWSAMKNCSLVKKFFFAFLQVKWDDADEGYGRHFFEYNHDYKKKSVKDSDVVPIRRL